MVFDVVVDAEWGSGHPGTGWCGGVGGVGTVRGEVLGFLVTFEDDVKFDNFGVALVADQGDGVVVDGAPGQGGCAGLGCVVA